MNYREVKVLERKLCDLESESVLKEMEACNKENMASVEGKTKHIDLWLD